MCIAVKICVKYSGKRQWLSDKQDKAREISKYLKTSRYISVKNETPCRQEVLLVSNVIHRTLLVYEARSCLCMKCFPISPQSTSCEKCHRHTLPGFVMALQNHSTLWLNVTSDLQSKAVNSHRTVDARGTGKHIYAVKHTSLYLKATTRHNSSHAYSGIKSTIPNIGMTIKRQSRCQKLKALVPSVTPQEISI